MAWQFGVAQTAPEQRKKFCSITGKSWEITVSLELKNCDFVNIFWRSKGAFDLI